MIFPTFLQPSVGRASPPHFQIPFTRSPCRHPGSTFRRLPSHGKVLAPDQADRTSAISGRPPSPHPSRIGTKALTKPHKRAHAAEAELAFPSLAEPRRQPFEGYALGTPYDEMFERDGTERPQYQILHERLQELGPDELRQRQQRADLSFLNQGITFTVYGQKES